MADKHMTPQHDQEAFAKLVDRIGPDHAGPLFGPPVKRLSPPHSHGGISSHCLAYQNSLENHRYLAISREEYVTIPNCRTHRPDSSPARILRRVSHCAFVRSPY